LPGGRIRPAAACAVNVGSARTIAPVPVDLWIPAAARWSDEPGKGIPIGLWKIAEAHLGNGAKYTDIFEANRPMLSDPDKIYPGQMLRIPGSQG